MRHAPPPLVPNFARRAVFTKAVDTGRVQGLIGTSPREQMHVASELSYNLHGKLQPKPANPWDHAPWPRSHGRSAIVTGGDMAAYNLPETAHQFTRPVAHGRRATLTGGQRAGHSPGRDPLWWPGRGARLDLSPVPKDALDQLVLETPRGAEPLGPCALTQMVVNHRIGRQSRRDHTTHDLHAVAPMEPGLFKAVHASAADPNALDWILNRRMRGSGANRYGKRSRSELVGHSKAIRQSQSKLPMY